MRSKGSQLLRKKFAEVGQSVVASACNVDIGTVSRWISEGKFDQFCTAVEAAGLKLLPAEYKCVKSQDELDHLMWWARKGMDSVKSAADLMYEDPE